MLTGGSGQVTGAAASVVSLASLVTSVCAADGAGSVTRLNDFFAPGGVAVGGAATASASSSVSPRDRFARAALILLVLLNLVLLNQAPALALRASLQAIVPMAPCGAVPFGAVRQVSAALTALFSGENVNTEKETRRPRSPAARPDLLVLA